MILAARDLALWALAVLPAAHALLAWRATSPAVVGVLGVLCALGQGIALPVGSRAFAGVAAVGRGRARVLLGLAHSGLALSAPVVAAAAPGLLPRITLLFAWLQVPALLLAASESGVLATLMNAGVLVALAALHGGLPAASAATCFLLVLPLFLTFDHWARTLASHPRARVPPFRVVLREAFGWPSLRRWAPRRSSCSFRRGQPSRCSSPRPAPSERSRSAPRIGS